ncbi:hypothetical protein DFQ28_010741 [Apophysomyces sp. BC1034]|nr:hypothetical protein DFQ30_010494 [Apophysomyces sp. BC1015]KAG0191880.1 hypothetical protein DFQ28_010741 [Apophysomyces sp. BC1034]
MVVVGDDNRVYTYNISSTGQVEAIGNIAVSQDANFSISWNHTSEKYAVASQDGTVHVWDIRQQQPLYKFGQESESITKNAARCVKFSQTGAIDLLAYSEHVSHINIVDARTFDIRQILQVGAPDVDTPITGLAFSLDSRTLFVGLEDAILEYPVDTSTRRRFPQGSLL